MKGIIFLILLTLLGIMSVSGSWSFFTDNQSSTSDQIVSGTLDLKTDDIDGVSQTLNNSSITPGNSVGPNTIVLKNSGSAGGSSLDISVSYIESDGAPNTVNMTADETAAAFEVAVMNYGGTDLLSGVSDINVNSYKDIQDVAGTDLSGQSGIAASATENFTIEITTDNGTEADFANDGIDITITFLLNQ